MSSSTQGRAERSLRTGRMTSGMATVPRMPEGLVLVTGGAGVIGSYVADALLDAGRPVRIVDCLHPAAHRGRPAYLRDDAEFLEGDLRDPAVAERAVAGIDAVCHQAAMVGLGVDLDNV